MNENNLTNKLDRVDSAIATMRNNLKIDASAPVEEVVKATNFALKDLMNIYIQEDEPTQKDGIWLKTTPFEYDSVTIDEKCHIKNTIDKNPGQHYPSSAALPGFIQYGDYVYQAIEREIYKYNPIDWTYEKIADAPLTVSAFTITNNKMYITCVNWERLYELDLTTLEITRLSDFSTGLTSTRQYAMGSVENYVAIFGTSKGVVYNTITKEYIDMPNYPRSVAIIDSFDTHTLPNWGGNILAPAFGSNMYYCSVLCFYDPRTNTFTNGMPHAQAYWPKTFSTIVIGNNLYILNGDASDKRIYVYDLKNQTYEKELLYLADYNPYYAKICNVNEQLVIFGGNYMNSQIYIIASDNSVYPDNTLVILQGKYKWTNREVCLFTLPETNIGKLQWSFNDIFPYINSEFMIDIPTYYGNGTEWIKYKN